jgi:hypothetical protein
VCREAVQLLLEQSQSTWFEILFCHHLRY